PGGARCNVRAQNRATRADDENVVLESFVVGHALENSPVVPDAHEARAHVEIGEADPEQTEPRPKHVAAIEAAHATIGLVAGRRAGKLIAKSADQMPERVAAKGEAAEQDHIQREHNRADANTEGGFPGGGIDEPKRLPDIR